MLYVWRVLGRAAAVAAVVTACDDLEPAAIDAVTTPSVTVRVLAPDGGEVVYPAEPVIVRWTGSAAPGSTLTYDVVASGMVEQTLATALELVAGDEGQVAWTPVGVASPTPYRIRVTATSASGESATDESDADFTVSPPTSGVSFAAHIQPVFTARCTNMFCHNKQSQVAVLDLTAGASYAQLVNVSSRENPCTSYMRVRPGVPDQSYLVFKLQGSGPCFAGVRMPKDAPALPSTDITAIRTWIANGAQNN